MSIYLCFRKVTQVYFTIMSNFKTLNRQFISNFKTTKYVTDAKRNLILSILKSTTTKREAKNYLYKYQNQFDFSDISFENTTVAPKLEKRDHQRELFINRFLRGQDPFLNVYDEEETKLRKIPLRVALFKICVMDGSIELWEGITETFRRLVHLGISPIIVLDNASVETTNFKARTSHAMHQAYKLNQYLAKKAEEETSTIKSSIVRSPFIRKGEQLTISSLEQILIPLYQGIIPILQPIEYTSATGVQKFVDANEALYTICLDLLNHSSLLTLEKVVIADKLGGIPSIERNQTSHVFINLSQELSDIISEMYIGFLETEVRDQHLKNLHIMNDILELSAQKSGNNDTTGIITTPEVIALNNDSLNPVIYNVLTDRPIISSSLPSSLERTPQVSTSILKKGFEVTVLDQFSYDNHFTFLNLVRDGLVDEDKLFNLISDSFRRPLDKEKYRSRIQNSIASIIIVGDYDGAAIVTWEELADGQRVAYLDKFAISVANQGLPSLADIIFKLVSQSHQGELIWRSRANNPVNKWYFERCRGSLGLQDSPWKLFYTGDIFKNRLGARLDSSKHDSIDITSKLRMYSDLIESIEPSFN